MSEAVIETPPVPPPATPPVETPPPSTPPAASTPPETPPVETPPVTPPPAAPEGLEPQAPASYALTLPEQTPLAPSDVERIQADAKALGLTQAQAQKYLEQQSQLVQAAVQQMEQEGSDLRADPVIGGANFTATVAHMEAGLSWLFGDEIQQAREFFHRLGLGNNKVLVKGLAKLGKATAEDTAIRAGVASKVERKETKDVMFPSSAKA